MNATTKSRSDLPEDLQRLISNLREEARRHRHQRTAARQQLSELRHEISEARQEAARYRVERNEARAELAALRK